MTDETAEPAMPTEGRLLGIDFGTRRIGFAVSDPSQQLAGPLANYTRSGVDADERYLTRLVKEHRVVGLVIGLPVHMSGDEGGMAREARAFGRWCAEITLLPICFWDERFTSTTAEQLMIEAELSKKKRKARLDKVAAQIMLQSYLDAEDREQAAQPM